MSFACLGLIIVSLLPHERVTAACSANVGMSAMAFSNDSRYFGATWDLRVIRIWDVQTQKVVQTTQLAPGEMLPQDLVFSPDGKLVAYAYHEIVHLLEFGSGKEVRTLTHNSQDPYGVQAVFVAGGQRLVTFNPKSAVLWDIQSGQMISAINALSDSTDVSADGHYLLTNGARTVTLWNIEAQKILRIFPGSALYNPVFSPDGTKAVVGVGDTTLIGLDTHNQRELFELTLDDAVDHVVFSPGGNLLYGAESNLDGSLRDGLVQLWDLRTGKKLYNTQPYPYLAGAFSADDSSLFLILGAYNRPIPFTVRTINVATGNEVRSLLIYPRENTDDQLGSYRFSPDRRFMVTTNQNNEILVWDLETGKSSALC